MRCSYKSYFICLLIVTICASCGKAHKYKGYTYNKKYDYYYQLVAFSESYKEAKSTDIVAATVAFSLVNADSVSFVADYEVIVNEQDSLSLSYLFAGVHSGDSLSFIVPTASFVQDGVFPKEYESLLLAEELQMQVKINSVLDTSSYQLHLKELALWKKTKVDIEAYQISQYLQHTKTKFVRLHSGIYKSVIHKGKSKAHGPEKGSLLTISYQGSTLRGEILNHFTTQDFTFGSEWQVIEGIELTLATMKEGERCLVIIPSEYAWGEEGSSDGSIEPYTPVVYDIELVKMTK